MLNLREQSYYGIRNDYADDNCYCINTNDCQLQIETLLTIMQRPVMS